MLLIGLSGAAGCGKTTIANHIVQKSAGLAYSVAFADPLRDVVQAIFGSRYATQEDKAKVDEFWNTPCLEHAVNTRRHWLHHGERNEPPGRLLGDETVTGRRILQFVGTDMFRAMVHADVWLMAMERRLFALHNADVVVIGDVRFDNEATFVRDHDGIVVKLSRIGQAEPIAGNHVSEKPISADLIDHDISVADGLAGAAAEMIYSLAVRRG